MTVTPHPFSLITDPGDKPTEGLHVCVYGRGSIGKTTLLGTMPGRGLVIDVQAMEGGTLVIKHLAHRIRRYPIKTWDEIEPLYQALQHDKHDFQWIAVDSLTGMTELARRKVGHSNDKNLALDPEQITLPGWGKIGSMVADQVWQFHKLRQMVIWTAQERWYQDKDTGAVFMGPSTTPDAFKRFWPSISTAGHLYAEGLDQNGFAIRKLRMGPPFGSIYAKARTVYGCPMPNVIYPDLGVALAYSLGRGPAPYAYQETPEQGGSFAITLG